MSVAADFIRHYPVIILRQACKTFRGAYGAAVSIQEIKTEIEALPAEERKRLAAFLVSLRHKEIAEYRAHMSRKIEDKNSENWATLEELDQRLEA